MTMELIYADRYLNEGTRTYSKHASYTDAQVKYRPNSRYPGFDMIVYKVPRDQMNIYTSNPPIKLSNKYLGADKILFCIHPQTFKENQDDLYIQRIRLIGLPDRGISVSPSSSTRTLYVNSDGDPHALKVHFPFKISRYYRKMRDEVIEQAIRNSLELELGIHLINNGFAFLREVIGVAHKNLQPNSSRGENWGYLIRDMRPFPQVDEDVILIQGFALYGNDFFDPKKQPFLFNLIGNNNPKEFVLNHIMLPVIRHWVGCFQHFGFLLEPHGQNVLLEINKDGEIKRIVHRDLSMAIDMRRRHDIHLPDNLPNSYNQIESGEFASITYDKFMGEHFFNRIVSTLQKKYTYLMEEDFRKPCRDEFNRIFSDHKKYLPKTIHYFSEELDQFGKPLYQDLGILPVWRP